MSLKPFDREVARQTLVDVYPILSPYFALAHGTALGAYRDKDFTPTEVDIDLLSTFTEVAFYAPEMIKALESIGFSIKAIQWRNTEYIRAFSAKRNGIKIDCAGYRLHALKKNYPKHALKLGDKVGYSTSILEDFSMVHPWPFLLRENMDTIDFQGLPWKIPAPTEDYLIREYGDWKTQKPFHHMQNSRVYGFETSEGIV